MFIVRSALETRKVEERSFKKNGRGNEVRKLNEALRDNK